VPSDLLSLILPLALGSLVALVLLAVAGYLARRALRNARVEANNTLRESQKDAESQAKEIVVAAQEKILAFGEEADARERLLEGRELELESRIRRFERDAASSDRLRKELERRETGLTRAEGEIREARAATEADREKSRKTLEQIASLSAQEARAQLISEIEEDARREGARLARKIEDEARETANQEALNLVVQATQRINVKKAVETTVSYIELPSDEMKGRIIGREGRNIRALETATGIDLIVDDTPRSIVVSSFDPVRREVARVAIQRLIEDGRIHPARIEEVVERVRAETEALVEETGTQAAFELGVSDIHSRLSRLIGRMKYGTHHGQNLLQHCMEVGLIAGYMASEVGGRVGLARRAGLLHEIGRVHETTGGPAVLAAAELAAKHGEPEEVVHSIRSLHRDADTTTVEDLLLAIANRISNNRPGARKENLEVFIERLRRLEEIAVSFPGVTRAFAVKAGKELRVIVDTRSVSDRDAYSLSKKIARTVEKDLSFQGKIKVNVVRETRAVQFAV